MTREEQELMSRAVQLQNLKALVERLDTRVIPDLEAQLEQAKANYEKYLGQLRQQQDEFDELADRLRRSYKGEQ